MVQCQQARTPILARLTTPDLTPREREIALMAASGLTNLQTAHELTRSVRTIDNHLQHVYTKLGIASRDKTR